MSIRRMNESFDKKFKEEYAPVEEVKEGYELLDGTKVELYKDYNKASARAKELGLKEAEYGDAYGVSYCMWNTSGDRNEDEEVIAYYKFEGRKPRPLTDDEAERIARDIGVQFEDFDESLKEANEPDLTPKERREFIAKMTKALMGDEFGYSREEANDIAIKRADALGSDWRVRWGGDIDKEIKQELERTVSKVGYQALYGKMVDKSKLKEGKRGFVRKYKGCSIHDAGDVFVCTNEHGLNIGQSRTESGCEGLIDEYIKNKGTKNESKLSERNLTKAERHNRDMGRIFANKKKQDDKYANFLKDKGYSDEQIKKLRDADDLSGEIARKFTPDGEQPSAILGKILKESQSQELTQYYRELKDENGFDVARLADAFYKTPEWREIGFQGDVLFTEKGWNAFKKWAKETKNVDIKDLGSSDDFLEEGRLNEKQWRHTLKNGNALRDAIESEDTLGILATLQLCYQELNEVGLIDDDDCDRWVQDIDDIDIEDATYDDIDWELEQFYDLCDNIGVWIPLNEEKCDEDTVKQGNYWVNKGKEGTHGKFKTKKEADAQRKAMYANGFGESKKLKESRGGRFQLSIWVPGSGGDDDRERDLFASDDINEIIRTAYNTELDNDEAFYLSDYRGIYEPDLDQCYSAEDLEDQIHSIWRYSGVDDLSRRLGGALLPKRESKGKRFPHKKGIDEDFSVKVDWAFLEWEIDAELGSAKVVLTEQNPGYAKFDITFADGFNIKGNLVGNPQQITVGVPALKAKKTCRDSYGIADFILSLKDKG